MCQKNLATLARHNRTLCGNEAMEDVFVVFEISLKEVSVLLALLP